MPKKKTPATEPAPMIGPVDKGTWIGQTLRAMQRPDAPLAVRQDFRAILEEYPHIADDYGDLALVYRRAALQGFEGSPLFEEAYRYETNALRAALLGSDHTPLEPLLVDTILACHRDYWAFNVAYVQNS